MRLRALRLGRPWWLITLGTIAAGIAAMSTPGREPSARPATQLTPATVPERIALPARQPLAKARGELFAPRSWAPPPVPVQAAAPEPPPAPSMPPNPYRFAGTAHYGGSLKAVLIRDEQVHLAQAGETLEGGYKVLSVDREGVTLLYTPLNVELMANLLTP
jgi:hypothetical protein